MTRTAKRSSYKIIENQDNDSFKVNSDRNTLDKIIKLLLEKNLFVKDNRNITSHYIEVDHQSLNSLLENGIDIGVYPESIPTMNPDILRIEKEVEQELEEAEYDLEPRIWAKETAGKKTYYCEIEGDIYSHDDLGKFIQFLNGEYLLESNKDITNLTTNPFKLFGITDVIANAYNSNKSLIRSPYKKQFNPVIEHVHHLKIIIDGADDTANALNNSGLPQRTAALLQGLLIFPIFLKGVHMGYEALGDEAKETKEEFHESDLKKIEFLVKLDSFKKELCEICGIPFNVESHINSSQEEAPEKFLKRLSTSLKNLKDDPDKSNKIIALALEYQREVEEEPEMPEVLDVLAAYTGWTAMTLMMTSVVTYEAQALVNIFGGIKNITQDSDSELSLFSQVGNSFAFGGQVLMTLYAAYKTAEEGKAWKEVEQELEELKNAKNVTDLAKEVTRRILEGNRDKHKYQTYGNATLAAGQAMMAVGGPTVIASIPLLVSGLLATIGGVGTNTLSELKHQLSYKIDENIDEVEQSILTTPPNFKKEELSNIQESLSKHAERQILQLEILGHLRAPQLVLYQKFIEKNKDDNTLTGEICLSLGGRAISKYLNTPPDESTKLVKDNPLITPHSHNPNDLDIFNVTKEDLEIATQRAESLAKEGKSHVEIIKEIQSEFIAKKHQEAEVRPEATSKELCTKIIEQGGTSALYLKKKLLRAVANGDVEYNGDLGEDSIMIKKNGKEHRSSRIEIEKFDEGKLSNFLSKKRPRKTTLGNPQKKSIIGKTLQERMPEVSSAHLRPFTQIPKVSKSSTDFLENNCEKPELSKSSTNVLENNYKDPEAPITNCSEKEDNKKDQEKPERKTKKKESTKKKKAITQEFSPQEDYHPEKELKENLNRLDYVAKEPVSQQNNKRRQQVNQQNNLIDDITHNKRDFVLESEQEIFEKNQTIFTYIHPDYQDHDPDSADYIKQQIIYIRNNTSGTVEVKYGLEAEALIVEKANEAKNAVITSISRDNLEFFGEKKNSIFTSFSREVSEDLPSKSPNAPLLDRKKLQINEKENSIMSTSFG